MNDKRVRRVQSTSDGVPTCRQIARKSLHFRGRGHRPRLQRKMPAVAGRSLARRSSAQAERSRREAGARSPPSGRKNCTAKRRSELTLSKVRKIGSLKVPRVGTSLLEIVQTLELFRARRSEPWKVLPRGSLDFGPCSCGDDEEEGGKPAGPDMNRRQQRQRRRPPSALFSLLPPVPSGRRRFFASSSRGALGQRAPPFRMVLLSMVLSNLRQSAGICDICRLPPPRICRFPFARRAGTARPTFGIVLLSMVLPKFGPLRLCAADGVEHRLDVRRGRGGGHAAAAADDQAVAIRERGEH